MALQIEKEIKKIENGLENVRRGGQVARISSYNNSGNAFGNNNTQPSKLRWSGLVFAVLK
jgi:hypothetical protein